ncbi:putative ester cyclase [Hasllibacter halocynthiae]|uniref:Putative ester cyclase n=1 Tax=Hasllibacter halocynthiae TaxID=595589 RepID=A0A2T0X7F9_9RHOB|nr:ester cyclase [Hasllibacter halocynthiae]PRY94869.1 putative ester cyclase [Hasllibacter halocynthiae]
MIEAEALKRTARDLLLRLADGADADGIYAPGAVLHVSQPWGRLAGAAVPRFVAELRAAIPDMTRRDIVLAGGTNRPDERLAGPRRPSLVAAIGTLSGTMRAPLRGIPATNGTVHLRYGETHAVEGGRIAESRIILDLVDLARQCGTPPLPPSLGAEHLWPGPATGDGIHRAGPWAGPDALETVFAMHEALHAFDGQDLDSMPHADHWTPDFDYMAGGGIGAMKGLAGFRACHQIPFLRAFPDRASEGHHVRLSDGPYAVTGGAVIGTHSAEWLGMAPTGRRVRIPVMDFYRVREDGRIAENWLPIDVVGAATDMGVDLLARVRHLAGERRTKL